MQFHQNGFHAGDPDIKPAANQVQNPSAVDVLIIGCGPAGLALAAQLAAFPDITTRIVEQKSGPMEKGQADGISCRSMEMFQAFGFAEKIIREAYWVNETSFWSPDPENLTNIHRSGRIQDVEDGLSEMPHVILNQARVHDRFLEIMQNAPARLAPDYDRTLIDLTVTSDDQTHPVTATLEWHSPGTQPQQETIKARYVVGCDGARSVVRQKIGRTLKGDRANQAWGVLDVLAVSDFPDFRLKALIKSAGEGNILLIPREGGHLVRLYVELDELSEGQRISTNDLTEATLIDAANRIFYPYSIDVKEVVWWSVYEVGHRLTDKFDEVPTDRIETRLPHVFIAGDACHTHSAKAGQGMNVSMGDTFNLGWKLISVLQGRCPPELLHSYSDERQKVAKDLIEFDHEWARIMGAPSTSDTSSAQAPLFQRYFVEHGRYTAGVSVKYEPSRLTGTPQWQHLATGFEIGTRLHSAPVIRFADAKPMQLGHVIEVDARWRLFAFADSEDPMSPNSAVARLCAYLKNDPTSPINMFTPHDGDMDAVIDVRAIYQQHHRDLNIAAMPQLLLPATGKHGLTDYEKMFCADQRNGDIYNLRGIDREQGCIVIVRPDQYVGHILPLDGYAELSAFFSGFMIAT
ncbi:FAD-binding monooxygenase [Shimia sp.]|uniref:FAD-binding monooxygenase n=1 Tax=Shimia sp. TaxID=1954381 RepID=UPI00329A3CBB